MTINDRGKRGGFFLNLGLGERRRGKFSNELRYRKAVRPGKQKRDIFVATSGKNHNVFVFGKCSCQNEGINVVNSFDSDINWYQPLMHTVHSM